MIKIMKLIKIRNQIDYNKTQQHCFPDELASSIPDGPLLLLPLFIVVCVVVVVVVSFHFNNNLMRICVCN